MKKTPGARKVVDETTQVRCALGKGVVREEVWQDSRGVAVKLQLGFFINHALCAQDNGRVDRCGEPRIAGDAVAASEGRSVAQRFATTFYKSD